MEGGEAFAFNSMSSAVSITTVSSRLRRAGSWPGQREQEFPDRGFFLSSPLRIDVEMGLIHDLDQIGRP